MLYDTSIVYAFQASLKYTVSELLLPDAMLDVAKVTVEKLAEMEMDL